MNATGSGLGWREPKNKKSAQHAAAKHVLEKIIGADLFVEWQIPGRTKQEALNYL